MRRSRVRPALALIALSAGLVARPAAACCPASPRDYDVRIADQEILVVWDPATKTEHFVRQAAFSGGRGAPAAGFGFLVPTPSRPEVAASSGKAFDLLREQTKPRIVHDTRWSVSVMPLVAYPFLLTAGSRSKSDAGITERINRGVDVLEETHVAGYDVAVLAASDPRALTGWLSANGYDARPALEEWAAPYVEKRWIITAFKYAARPGDVATDAVRMSFQTDAPLFPYRVPTDNIAAQGRGNLLRTFVVAPGRATGTLGEGQGARPWSQAEVKRARRLPAGELERLVGQALPAGAVKALGDDAWLTAFEDRTWPSGTDDLTFTLDPKGAEYEEVIHIEDEATLPLPADVLVGLGLLGIFVRRRLKGAPKAEARTTG